jgi:tetratricopeptide (TPR) repeat protein
MEMEADRRAAENRVERRYGTVAATEWELVLGQLDLGEGFSLLVVLVPDRDGSEICRLELEDNLAAAHKRLLQLDPKSPDELKKLASTLLEVEPEKDVAAIWLSAVSPRSAEDYEGWVAGWQFGLAALNQQRNPLRRKFSFPLIFVGAPWLAETFRTIAPDLWSVRTLVVRIEPARETGDRRLRTLEQEQPSRAAPARTDESAADPAFALEEANRIRGHAGQEPELAGLLERAGLAFFARGDLATAESQFREALEVRTGFNDDPVARGATLHLLARTVLDQHRSGDAEALFRQALALREAGGDAATGRGSTTHELAWAILQQGGRAPEAEALLRQALALKEEGGDTATSRGITTHVLGRAVRAQGRAAEAETLFRQALALREAGGDTTTGRGVTTHELAWAVLQQGRAPEAEALLRQTLALKEEGGDTATSRGITTHVLGLAVLAQGRTAEAETLFRQALALREERGDTATGRGVTTHELARTILAQGRAAEAEALFREALRLEEQGGATLTYRGATTHELARTTLAQGRADEAVELFRQALALRERGRDTSNNLRITREELARVIEMQQRAEESQRPFRTFLRRLRKLVKF